MEQLGSGAGYGHGASGAGYGYGAYGDGSGSGAGYGSGAYAYGYGAYGDGSGSGAGYGSGAYAYGYGAYGAGAGDPSEYLDALIDVHKKQGVTICFWRCNKDGTPANGGSGTVASEGYTEQINGPLAICSRNALHGTNDPRKWSGEYWWIVALHNPVQQHEDKFGSLKRTFIKALGKYPFTN